MDHVFRGVKHKIVFHLNKVERLIQKANAVPNGKVNITKCVWMIPYAKPSLKVMNDLETQLANNPAYPLSWMAMTVHKEQPPKKLDICLPFSGTIHKPQKIWVAFQNLNCYTSQNHSCLLYTSDAADE